MFHVRGPPARALQPGSWRVGCSVSSLAVTVLESLDAAGPRTFRLFGPRQQLILVVVALVVSPLVLRLLNREFVGEPPPAGYLPSLEIHRPRLPFAAERIAQLQYGNPAWVFIGDSMLGTRIDPILLGTLSTTHNQIVAMLQQAATGPAWWYLAFKNALVASGVQPRAVFFFFRDTNLTDTLFRLETHYGGGPLDTVALESEPELDAIVAARKRGFWSRLHMGVDRTYQLDLAGQWLAPFVHEWYLKWRYPNPAERAAFEASVEEKFAIENLRHSVTADMASTDDAEFERDLPTSVLPLIMDLAHAHDLQLCFVRVQRRPEGGRPPKQSPALRRYIADLKAWLTSHGALFHDDTGDPEMTLDLYRDGDHVGDRARYTRIFRQRMDALFR